MAKCYVVRCLVCEGLFQAERRDALTCGGRCRVRLHRHPEIRERVASVADTLDVPLFTVLLAGAVRGLRPDLDEMVSRGKVTLDEIQPEMNRTLVRALLDQEPA